MKNSILIMAVVAFFTFSCNTEDASELNEQNLSLEKDSHFSNLLRSIESSIEFRDFMTSSQFQRNAEDHGLMLLDDGWSISYAVFDGDLFSLIGGVGSIQAKPNGRAKFSVHTNNPNAAIIDFTTFTTLYSSDCVEGNLGVFNLNIISGYDTVVFPFGTFYFPNGENATPQVANGHCEISDAQAMYNEVFEFIGCTDATDFKTIRLSPNGEGGSDITLE